MLTVFTFFSFVFLNAPVYVQLLQNFKRFAKFINFGYEQPAFIFRPICRTT